MSLFRKVIQIKATDSPNVRLALAERAEGLSPSGEILVPGLLPWSDYVKRRSVWDRVRQRIGLDAEFYEGAETLMYPPGWLDRAARIAEALVSSNVRREAVAIGIDPAEGGDLSAWSVIDFKGLLHHEAERTADTTIIVEKTIELIHRFNVVPDKVYFDRGGGGKQHADRLRRMGYPVNTVSFGESVVLDPVQRLRLVKERIEVREDQTTYFNRRSQMYGILRDLLDPAEVGGGEGFGIPAEYEELRAELAPIPLSYDEEGRIKLPSKNKPNRNSTVITLTDLIGHSPDRADSLVVAIWAMVHEAILPTVSAW